jgi:uroporphyrinogen-III synthase
MSSHSPQPAEPLRGVRVLITRAAGDAAALRDQLQALGAEVVEAPAIEIRPPENPAALDVALRGLHSYDWLVCTSRIAVRCVIERLAALVMPPPSELKIAAVSGSTAAELRVAGLEPVCVAPDGTASGLAGALVARGIAGSSVLIPQGNLAREDLAARLRAAGARVDTVIAYRTAMPDLPDDVRRMLQGGRIDAALFASPSAVRNLVTALGEDVMILRCVRLVCMGPTTAEAVRALGLEPAEVAAERSNTGMIEALLRLQMGDRTV